jgi:hypothetical protein
MTRFFARPSKALARVDPREPQDARERLDGRSAPDREVRLPRDCGGGDPIFTAIARQAGATSLPACGAIDARP